MSLLHGRVGLRLPAFLAAALLILVVAPGTRAKQAAASPPVSVNGVACSQAKALGLLLQMNYGASEILAGCGLLGKSPATTPAGPGNGGGCQLAAALGPPANVLVSDGDATFPHCTRSEAMVWSSDGCPSAAGSAKTCEIGHPRTVVVNFNDSRDAPSNLSGVAYSLDGGQTFTHIIPSPFATGHGRNVGDPVVVFNDKLRLWFAGDLVQRGDCGNQGIGLWTSPDGVSWTPGACAHVGTSNDRESMWVDNGPNSPHRGEMYVSYNIPTEADGFRLYVTHSPDGVNWSEPIALTDPGPLSEFHRDVQLTGDPDDGTVYLVAMRENGGGLINPRQNILFRSFDGGVSWDRVTMGAPFLAAGDSLCSNPYFPRFNPIWRQTGFGQPAGGPKGTVHYVYNGRGVNPGDTGDIFYTRSDDHGSTWSDPIVLNTDQASGGTASQWMPSLSANSDGVLQAAWYDRRDTTDGQNYEYFGRKSLDNGLTWEPDGPISDQLIPQPEQLDPNIQPCYAGDYNYHTAFGATAYTTWTDGRFGVPGHQVQNVFFAAPSLP